ncbi:YopX family protein [Staphylococcus hominis]|uniref:YopX family protein n=1 Tax=Staphylococcus hominis TaxID=1290 RepID=UPI001F573C63|nr:YopX family protein [Staphylococcus hominis]MCI2919068.1 YopX family protein [Staphylococcus hominis]MDS3927142.1 YopX family protein [Staphylococcus hominis]
MESISFRAWDKEEKKMHKVKTIEFSRRGARIIHLAEVNSNGKGDHKRWHSSVELMQSTGLKDINGTEIYEGDIVKVLVQDIEPKIMKDKMYIGVVAYNQGTFDIKISKDTYLGIIPEMYMLDIDCVFEILGDKFQNPELLEGE